MTIQERQTEIVEAFAMLDDWEQKYELIIDFGKQLPAFNDENKKPENLIRGCQSQVWMVPQADEATQTLSFEAESDALIVRGLVAMLLQVFNGQKPKDIVDADLKFIDDIGMTQHLAQTRSNGLLSMVKQIKFYALAYQAKGW